VFIAQEFSEKFLHVAFGIIAGLSSGRCADRQLGLGFAAHHEVFVYAIGIGLVGDLA
jgi:hypothetical protein